MRYTCRFSLWCEKVLITMYVMPFIRWIYVSNAEVSNGGVGAITFNPSGEVIDYEMIMTDTSINCGGGKTYWGTWVSCEEFDGGQGS